MTITLHNFQVDDNKRVQAAEGSDEKDTSVVLEEPSRNAENKIKTYCVYKLETSKMIHVNVEELTLQLQTEFVKTYLEELKKFLAENDISYISFNNIYEDVFRYHLNMPIRKYNFVSSFQRYIDDKGLAVFTKKDVEVAVMAYKSVGKSIRKPQVVH